MTNFYPNSSLQQTQASSVNQSFNGPIANIMVGMQIQGLPIDYIATRNDKVNAVTLEDLNRVARELLSPENLHFVVVGQPEGLEAATE